MKITQHLNHLFDVCISDIYKLLFYYPHIICVNMAYKLQNTNFVCYQETRLGGMRGAYKYNVI